jgi:hypothetical protein
MWGDRRGGNMESGGCEVRREGEQVRWDGEGKEFGVEEGREVGGEIKELFGELRNGEVSIHRGSEKRNRTNRFGSPVFKQIECTIRGYDICIT